MMYLCNAFSLNMMDPSVRSYSVKVEALTLEQAEYEVQSAMSLEGDLFLSAIGHDDTARIVGKALNQSLSANRVSLSLNSDDVLVVAQYRGPRLPEGSTELPEGASIDFFYVSFDRLT